MLTENIGATVSEMCDRFGVRRGKLLRILREVEAQPLRVAGMTRLYPEAVVLRIASRIETERSRHLAAV